MTALIPPSPLALVLFLLQDDSATSNVPIGSPGSALLETVRNSGPVAQAVLVILLLASLFSWSIMLSKGRAFARARKEGTRFLRTFRKTGRLSELAAVAEQFQPSPLVPIFVEINDEYQRQSGGRGLPRNPVALERAALTASSEALTNMESRMTWLATIAAAAPFIGLFGTVMGIMAAFHDLGTSGAATLRTVAPGISAALITTAAGLFVAIPAVVGYNQLTAQLREFAARMDDFGRELLNAIENAAMLTPAANASTQAAAPPTPQPSEDPLAQIRRRTF